MKSKKTNKSAKKTCPICPSNDFLFFIIGVLIFIIIGGVVYINNLNKISADALTMESTTLVSTKTELTKFVEDAAVLVAKDPNKAYTEFRKQGGEWWKGDRYVFVYDMTGKTLVLPPEQNLEGTNRLSVKDPNGVYFVKQMVETLKTANSGWVNYSYPKPGTTKPLPKSSYFMKVKVGNSYVIVGSGYYL